MYQFDYGLMYSYKVLLTVIIIHIPHLTIINLTDIVHVLILLICHDPERRLNTDHMSQRGRAVKGSSVKVRCGSLLDQIPLDTYLYILIFEAICLKGPPGDLGIESPSVSAL